MPSVFIVNGGESYARMFRELGWEVVNYLELADLVQFCGGHDVSPDFYGEHPHPTTSINRGRDVYEAAIYSKALSLGIPMAGICRGGQFLNVLNGGGLYQHVTGHALGTTHDCYSVLLDQTRQVTSTHHQMMIAGDGAFIDGWTLDLSPIKYRCPNGKVEEQTDSLEAEVIFYEATNCLCFQPHPEYYGADECRSYFFQAIRHYLGEQIQNCSDSRECLDSTASKS